MKKEKIHPLRLWLMKKGIYASDLAKVVSYTPTSLRNYITGRTKISKKGAMLIEIATSGEVTAKELLDHNPKALLSYKPQKRGRKKESELEKLMKML
jgi:hypothetical protein